MQLVAFERNLSFEGRQYFVDGLFFLSLEYVVKFKGQTVSNTNIEYVVIPRPSGNIVFIAKPVLSLDSFNEICKEPQPPTIEFPTDSGRAPEKDFSDEKYLVRLSEFFATRFHWMQLMSLKDSPDIEWETVDYLKPETYKNMFTELEAAGFLPAEVNKITEAVATVNALDERQLDEARKSFLASLQAQDN